MKHAILQTKKHCAIIKTQRSDTNVQVKNTPKEIAADLLSVSNKK